MPRPGDSVCRRDGLWQKGNMSDVARHELTFLPPLTARLARAAARPRAVAAACVLALTALGWLYLGVMYARHADLFAALCRPAAASGEALALLLPMWSAMALAMMVPSASATILTYAEIADTAARKQIEVVSPVVIVAGYVAVWLGFALAASLAQLALARAGWLDPNAGKLGAYISAALFVLAGGYQFTTLKHACLRQCRNPFQFFFSNWQTTARAADVCARRDECGLDGAARRRDDGREARECAAAQLRLWRRADRGWIISDGGSVTWLKRGA
jgi:predicted metal-binding membrane protein